MMSHLMRVGLHLNVHILAGSLQNWLTSFKFQEVPRHSGVSWYFLVLLGTKKSVLVLLGTKVSVLVLLGTKTLCSLGIIMAYSLFKKLHSNCMFVFRGAYLSNRHDDGEE